MNLNIRQPPRGPRTPVERAMAEWVSALTARVRGAELRALDPGGDDPFAAARSLVAQGWRIARTRDAVERRAAALRSAAAKLEPGPLRALLTRHLRETAPPHTLAADLRALRRDLDLDALLEREAEQIESAGAQLEVIAEALGGLVAQNARLSQPLLSEVQVVALLEALIGAEPRPGTRRAAARALVRVALAATPHGAAPPGRDALFALITDPAAELWSRRAALEIHAALPEPEARALLNACATATGQDAFILRARAVEMATQRGEDWAVQLLRRAARDPSELVRFTAATGLAGRLAMGDTRCFAPLDRLLRRDADPELRRFAAYALRRGGVSAPSMLARGLEDPHPAVVEQSLESLGALFDAGIPPMLSTEEDIIQLIRAAEPAVARAAAELHCRIKARKSRLYDLAEHLAQLREGEVRRVALPAESTARALAEALVPFAARGFGFTLDAAEGPDAPGARVFVWRGERSALALWRLLHELRNPQPAKRQGHSHAVGRADLGALRVPPGGLAEENATGVPGQRVRIPAWRGWAPAVPLVDDALHALRRGEVCVVTAEGTTTLRAPRALVPRLRAWWRLTWSFAELDRLRSASLSASTAAGRSAYSRALRALGLGVQGPEQGPARPFLVLDPLAFALSMGSNTVPHLIATMLLLAALLYGRVARVRSALVSARRRIPLCIGGWGTRGKSGTERLKAGLFEGLGLPLLSKTTGCEAMVLHAPPGGRAMELFLFRPFDKATIWEQARVTRLGAALGSRVFLWECMGLNPLYVDILQRGWMNDDLVTLTNAYPDHEDIQGPTGQDVARAIGGFAPKDALVLTAESSMLPILREEAARQGSAILALGRAERELVPRDLLARMPHAEHPGNVALVARMAEELGLDPVEAIGLMADHVLPDLGALVVTPTVNHEGRRLTFVNGMSANDEVSFRHNWRYTGFAEPGDNPALWIMTVVNNRADRVPRSRVFARILVEQAHANRHLLIGTNLEGMRAYIDEALARMLSACDQPESLFRRLRLADPLALAEALLPETPTAWRDACAALPPIAGIDAARAAARALPAPGEPALAEALIEAAARHAAMRGALRLAPEAMKEGYAELFRASLVFIDDPGANGDEIVHTLVQLAPPNAEIRAMGVQNIKGTGLDFAYQWVYLRQAHAAGQRLRASETRAAALSALEALPMDSALVIDQALAALESIDDPDERARLLAERLRRRRAEVVASRGVRRARSRVGRIAERLLDPFDAILRAARARQVLDDLAARRISHKRAQAELRRLSARQKGGWW